MTRTCSRTTATGTDDVRRSARSACRRAFLHRGPGRTVGAVSCRRPPRSCGWGRLGLLVIALICPATCRGQTGEGEDAMLRTLCEHGLSDTALQYVAAQLRMFEDQPRDSVAAADALARWTMRQMFCHALAGLRGDGDQWQACRAVHDRFAEQHPQNRRLPWVHWQMAQCLLIQAKDAYARYLAVPGREPLRDAALQRIREIERWVDQVRDEVQQRQPLAARLSRDSPEQAPAVELSQLAADADLLQCEALLVRARLYPRGSADRIAAATAVAEIADRAIQKADPDWDALPALRAARAIAALELDAPTESVRELTRLIHALADRPVGRQSGLALVEFWIERGETSRARSLVEAMRRGGASPEQALAELLLRIADLPGEEQKDARSEAFDQIVRFSKRIGEQFGAYWRNRAEAVLFQRLGQAVSTGSIPAGTEFVKAEVRQLLATGDTQAAIVRLCEAAERAWTDGNRSASLELSGLALALMERDKQWSEVADLVDEAADRWADVPTAAGLHVRGIVALARSLRSDPGDADVAQRYERFLLRQLRRWPDAAPTDTAQAWLRDWFEARRRPVEYAQAVWERAARCTDAPLRQRLRVHWLAYTVDLSPELAEAGFHRAREWIDQRDAGKDRDDADLFLQLADVLVRWSSPDESRRRRADLLRRAASARDALLETLLYTGLVLEVARHGSLPDVVRQTRAWKADDLPREVLAALLRPWGEVVEHQPPGDRSSWADALQMKAIPVQDLLSHRDPLHRVRAHRAAAWSDPQLFDRGLEAVRREAQTHRRDGWIQLQYAGMLLERSPPGWEESQGIVKRVIANSTAASRLNLAARWMWVQILLWRDQPGPARDYARLVIASHPTIPEPINSWLNQIANP